MRRKKAVIWILLTLFVLALIFPVLLLMAGSFMGTEELRESYGSVLYGDSGNLQWKLFPLYPTLKAYLQLLLDSPDFFVMFWNSCRQVFPILGGQLTTFRMPAAWALADSGFGKKDDSLSVYDSDDSAFSGNHGVRLYGAVFSACTGYPLVCHTAGHFLYFPGISYDKIFSADTGHPFRGGKGGRCRSGNLLFLHWSAPGNSGRGIFSDSEFSGILECH